jgi:hypothetical protein
MGFIEWSQLLHGIGLVAHVLQDWQSSVIFRAASPNVRKFKPFDRCQHHGKCECLVLFVEPSTRTPNKDFDLTFSLSI